MKDIEKLAELANYEKSGFDFEILKKVPLIAQRAGNEFPSLHAKKWKESCESKNLKMLRVISSYIGDKSKNAGIKKLMCDLCNEISASTEFEDAINHYGETGSLPVGGKK
jgi:hypothetical protein